MSRIFEFMNWLYRVLNTDIGTFGSSNGFDWFEDDDHKPVELPMPAVNIDGTPMCGWVDFNGNPFGVTSSYEPISDDW